MGDETSAEPISEPACSRSSRAGNSSRICSASSWWAAVNSLSSVRSAARNRARNNSASPSIGSRSEP